MNRLVFAGEAPGAQPEAPADKPEATPDAYSDPSKREALLKDAQTRLDSMDSSDPDRSALETKLTKARIAETVGTQEAQQAANDLYQALNPGVTQEVAPVTIVGQGPEKIPMAVTGKAAEKVVKQAETSQEGQTQKGLAGLRGAGIGVDIPGPRVAGTAGPEIGPKAPETAPESVQAAAVRQARQMEMYDADIDVPDADGSIYRVRVGERGNVYNVRKIA